MPDTGAPWNIPYVAGTDLVSDWPTDSLALANAIDAGLDAANVGIGSNVVQTVKTNSFATTSTSYVQVTDFDVTITPSSASSKVLIVADMMIAASSNVTYFQLYRGATAIYVGGSGDMRAYNVTNNDPRLAVHPTIVFLDSPATTSATTYSIHIKRDTGTAVFNRPGNADVAYASTITAIEVAA